MGFPASTYRFIDEHASSSTEQCALARPASAICDDMLTQKPSGGGQSEKDCREPHRIGGVARAASVGCVVREPRVIRISPTESIEPPVPLRAQARYVLQVTPGSERAMAERVKALAGPELVRDCFALSCRVLRKNQGVWRLVTETMFPGYLFVASDDIEAFEKTIKRSTAFARLLGAERRAFALRPEEASFVHDFGGPSHVVGFSRGTIDNGRTIIDEGPLRGHVDRIKKIDRHKRIAYLDIGLLDQKQVRVGLEIVRKT